MCGRYRLSRRKQIIEEHFDSVSGEEDWSPRYVIALLPPQPVPVIRQNPKEPRRELSLMRWGLIPSWAYFGIGEETAHTLEEIGQRFNLTRERARQIKEKALRRLKHSSRSQRLRVYRI